MSNQITRKDAHGWNGTIQVGYCAMYHLLRYRKRYGYNSGIYGWNFNCYIVNGISINTGYRNMVGKIVDYQLVDKYEKKAMTIQEKRTLTDNQKKYYTEKLLQNLLKKIA